MTRESKSTYRFVIDRVEYRGAVLEGGEVGIIVRAVDIGDLAARPSTLKRSDRLEFSAEGRASGAFEVKLFLIDPEGRDQEPRTLTRICDGEPPAPRNGASKPGVP